MDVNVTKLVVYREENKRKFLQENAVKTHLYAFDYKNSDRYN